METIIKNLSLDEYCQEISQEVDPPEGEVKQSFLLVIMTILQIVVPMIIDYCKKTPTQYKKVCENPKITHKRAISAKIKKVCKQQKYDYQKYGDLVQAAILKKGSGASEEKIKGLIEVCAKQ